MPSTGYQYFLEKTKVAQEGRKREFMDPDEAALINLDSAIPFRNKQATKVAQGELKRTHTAIEREIVGLRGFITRREQEFTAARPPRLVLATKYQRQQQQKQQAARQAAADKQQRAAEFAQWRHDYYRTPKLAANFHSFRAADYDLSEAALLPRSRDDLRVRLDTKAATRKGSDARGTPELRRVPQLHGSLNRGPFLSSFDRMHERNKAEIDDDLALIKTRMATNKESQKWRSENFEPIIKRYECTTTEKGAKAKAKYQNFSGQESMKLHDANIAKVKSSQTTAKAQWDQSRVACPALDVEEGSFDDLRRKHNDLILFHPGFVSATEAAKEAYDAQEKYNEQKRQRQQENDKRIQRLTPRNRRRHAQKIQEHHDSEEAIWKTGFDARMQLLRRIKVTTPNAQEARNASRKPKGAAKYNKGFQTSKIAEQCLDSKRKLVKLARKVIDNGFNEVKHDLPVLKAVPAHVELRGHTTLTGARHQLFDAKWEQKRQNLVSLAFKHRRNGSSLRNVIFTIEDGWKDPTPANPDFMDVDDPVPGSEELLWIQEEQQQRWAAEATAAAAAAAAVDDDVIMIDDNKTDIQKAQEYAQKVLYDAAVSLEAPSIHYKHMTALERKYLGDFLEDYREEAFAKEGADREVPWWETCLIKDFAAKVPGVWYPEGARTIGMKQSQANRTRRASEERRAAEVNNNNHLHAAGPANPRPAKKSKSPTQKRRADEEDNNAANPRQAKKQRQLKDNLDIDMQPSVTVKKADTPEMDGGERRSGRERKKTAKVMAQE